MNNKKTITICAIAALVVLAIVIVISLMTNLTSIAVMLVALFIILTICLGIYMKDAPDEYTAYIKERKKILRTYNSVLVEVEDIPNIAGKNIIKVMTIDDLVDAQLELREPIYYKNDNDSAFFLLLHYNEACIYILKMNDSVISPTEQSIKYMKEDKKELEKASKDNILENLENTVVYKLDELRSFKISPIRNEGKIEIVDDTAIKEELKNSEVHKEALESEISKTTYIKELKEKIDRLEQEELAKQEARQEKIKKIKEDAKKEETKISIVKEAPKKVRKPIEPKKIVSQNAHSRKRAEKYNNKNKSK